MRRYAPRSAFIGYTDEGHVSITADEVIIQDDDPEPTGLLDADGNELYRVRERIKFGFHKE